MRLESVDNSHWLEIDDVSGLPVRVGSEIGFQNAFASDYRVAASLTIVRDGGERRAPTGGIEYFDTVNEDSIRRVGDPELVRDGERLTFRVPITIGSVGADIIYGFATHGPAVTFGIDLKRSNYLVRDLILDVAISIAQPPHAQWIVNIPGNGLRANLPVSEIIQEIGISPLGGLRGSAALTHLGLVSDGQSKASVVLWVDNEIEIPEITARYRDGNFSWKVKSGFASDLNLIERIRVPLISLQIGRTSWQEFPVLFDGWLRSRGIASPANVPDWVAPALIFEAQIGFSVFAHVHKYSPYPTPRDLINDLDRIAGMGFTCIQLMPRQPYPSYNVHDYWDIDTSYGAKQEIKELVAKAHQLGIKVILDVLLHGVLDKEIITIAADGVRSGPFKDLISSETNDSFSSDVKDWHNYLIAWSRHILDFEDYWREGSPDRTPLEDKYPEWFYRDSNGAIAGVYTKAFDARNAQWQQYFTDAMRNLVSELDIDGFRFDAPTYNDFHNWAPWARSRAGASALACTALFERMRPEFKALKPEFLFYTEPSGLSLRKSMDLNYNYDEQWLVTALANPETRSAWGVRSAKELAEWMKDRDSLLPQGSMTAHHIDSHDTFWWPSWGKKWRREQFGMERTRLLTIMFASLPGPFMMFIGGESGIEDLLPQLASMKQAERGESGWEHWWVDSATPDSIFGITRKAGDSSLTTLLNFASDAVTLPSEVDLVGFEMLLCEGELSRNAGTITLAPMSAIVFRSRS